MFKLLYGVSGLGVSFINLYVVHQVVGGWGVATYLVFLGCFLTQAVIDAEQNKP